MPANDPGPMWDETNEQMVAAITETVREFEHRHSTHLDREARQMAVIAFYAGAAFAERYFQVGIMGIMEEASDE